MRKGRRVGNDRVRNEGSPIWTIRLGARLPTAIEDFRHGCAVAGDIPIREGLEAGDQTGVYNLHHCIQTETAREYGKG